MTALILMMFSVSVVEFSTHPLAPVMSHVLAARFDAPFAGARHGASERDTPVGLDVVPVAKKCQSCKDDRKKKNPPLPAVDVVKLAAIATRQGFRKPEIPVIVCPYCDGETLVSSALRNIETLEKKRQAE